MLLSLKVCCPKNDDDDDSGEFYVASLTMLDMYWLIPIRRVLKTRLSCMVRRSPDATYNSILQSKFFQLCTKFSY